MVQWFNGSKCFQKISKRYVLIFRIKAIKGAVKDAIKLAQTRHLKSENQTCSDLGHLRNVKVSDKHH